jgi:hypothetical protein
MFEPRALTMRTRCPRATSAQSNRAGSAALLGRPRLADRPNLINLSLQQPIDPQSAIFNQGSSMRIRR